MLKRRTSPVCVSLSLLAVSQIAAAQPRAIAAPDFGGASVRSDVVKDGNVFLSPIADRGIHDVELTMRAKLGASATSIGAAGGSGAAPNGGRTQPAAIEGRVWRLTRLRGQSDESVAALPQPISIRMDTGKVQSFSGCTSLASSYLLDGDMVRFGKLAGPIAACAPAVMAIERAFTSALSGTLRVEADANELTLSRVLDSEPLLVFVADRDSQ
jgi:heat shock protein HslJ